MSDQEIAISVKNVFKSFKLPHEQHSGIKQVTTNAFKKNKKRGYETQNVLNNISFDVKKGEFFGIVGRNGSGKSTLLKLISEIYVPDRGSIRVNGTLTPFIELGVGFNPELTGRENVYMNGALLGFSNMQMDALYDEIVEFAELERFMDQKLKNYSSGMQVRLAFSIAIRADTDILVLDEVLAVGDEAFQRKCYQYFAELKRNKKTVILVTHSMDSVQRFCTKAMLIDKGEILEIGSTTKVAQKYRELNDTNDVTVNVNNENDNHAQTKYIDADMSIERHDGVVTLELTLRQKKKLDNPVVVINLFRSSGEQVYRWASDERIGSSFNFEKQKKVTIKLKDVFPVGQFTAGVRIVSKDRGTDYATINDMAGFEVKNETNHQWDVYWRLNEQYDVTGKS